MPRIRMIIQYDGTNYVGWQTQPNGVAVQSVIESELEKILGAHVSLQASGRTDSGVHAMAQVAHFDTAARMPADKFAYALNAGLPRDIRIKYSGLAPESFHSRFDAKHKQYRYTVLNSAHGDAFLRDRALHLHYGLDYEALQNAAAHFEGEHNFLAFKSVGTEIENTVRTIFSSKWRREGELFLYDVEGSGFMYNMVRIMVGTMLEIGMGRRDPDCIGEAMDTGERSCAGATAPAHGLMLMRVRYADFDTADYVPID